MTAPSLAFLDSPEFQQAVQTCATRALEGRPVPAHLVAQAQFYWMDAHQWQLALDALRHTLEKLDGRNATRWGLSRNQGARFCQWRKARLLSLAEA